MEEKVEYTPQEQPIGTITKKDYQFVLSAREFEIIDQFMNIFAMPNAIVNNLKNKAFAEKGIVPVFKDDVDDKGLLKNPEEFWKKHSPPTVAE